MVADIDSLVPIYAVPSILRKGAPVYDMISEQTVTFVSLEEPEQGKEQRAIVGPIRGRLALRKVGFLYLDLRDPVGRNDAVAWLLQKGRRVGEGISGRDLKAVVLDLARRLR